MRKYSYLALSILLAVACNPDVPVPPMAPPSVDSLGVSTMDVAFDDADKTAYNEVLEMVVTDEDNEDYGDFIENYEAEDTIIVSYNGIGATITGGVSDISVEGAHVTVDRGGENIVYVLTGTTDNGSFKISYSKKKTQIVLDGVRIMNPTGAAINIQSSKTIIVKIADGTTNYLEDGSSYELIEGEQQKGTFFSEGQLIFSGNGSLIVKSNYGHGIASDDYVRVRGGNITIKSTRDGINAKERFVMYGGTVDIEAGQDGLDVGEGYIEIGAGKLNIQAVDEGLTASYEGDDDGHIDDNVTPYIDIKGGFVKVATTGDKGHALRAMSTFSMSGGCVVQAITRGAGSKALMSEGDMSLSRSRLTAITEGGVLSETIVSDTGISTNELSSSAAIRSKGKLMINSMVVGVKNTGMGSKGINNVGDVILNGSEVKIIATGLDFTFEGERARAYGISTDGTLDVSGTTLLIRTTRTPIKAGVERIADDVVFVCVTTEV